MDKEPDGCLICHSPIVYGDSVEMRCCICGETFESNARCAMGHYVCDRCHSSGSTVSIRDICLASTETDPIAIAQRCMMIPSVHMHGPEHHVLVGSAILAACRNSGHDIDLPAALEEMHRRGSVVPGSICGNWGCCGAAVSSGTACSIILKSTPLSEDVWGVCIKLTGRCLQEIGEIGGPRCCKRDSFTAIRVVSEYFRENLGIDIPVKGPVLCDFHNRNPQCKGTDCPYFRGA